MSLPKIETVLNRNTAEEKNMLLSYYNYIAKQTVEEQYVEYNVAQKYRGDYYGLLHELNVPGDEWFITLLLNGMKSPYQYKGEAGMVRTADRETVNGLLRSSQPDITANLHKDMYRL